MEASALCLKLVAHLSPVEVLHSSDCRDIHVSVLDKLNTYTNKNDTRENKVTYANDTFL